MRDSVYRILNDFATIGLIARLDALSAERYDTCRGPHAHFICEVCGSHSSLSLGTRSTPPRIFPQNGFGASALDTEQRGRGAPRVEGKFADALPDRSALGIKFRHLRRIRQADRFAFRVRIVECDVRGAGVHRRI